MNPIPPAVLSTFEDFCSLVKDGEKADLIEGVIYMASPENIEANELFGWLLSVLTFFVRGKDLGRVFGSRAAFRLDENNSPEPDLAFVRKDRLALAQRGFFGGPPDFAIEIVSPESVGRDYEQKREQYERFGVNEYWILDPIEQRVAVCRLGRDGKYRETRRRKGRVQSRSVPGFWLRVEWLWQDPLPDPNTVFAEILS